MTFRSALSVMVPLAMLAACAVSQPDRPLGEPASAPVTPQPVVGIVESASVVSLPSVPSAAAGGASGPSSSPTMAYRVQMPDGRTQSVVQAGERFAVGDRVRVTADGRLTRP